MKKVLQIFILTVAFACIVPVSSAKAFAISPLKQQITAAPGASGIIVSVTVGNEEKEKMSYSLKVLGAKQLENGRLVYGSGISSAEQWVSPEVNSVEILPGQIKQADFVVNIPRDAPAGSYFLGLAAGTDISGGEKEAVGVSGQVISVLLIQVAGVVNESLTIENWQLPGLTVSRDWPASVLLENGGTTELPVTGEVIVRDWLGRQVYSGVFQMTSVLLPGSARKQSVDISLPDGRFYPVGPYQAEIKIKFGLTGQKTVALGSVWYLPYYSFVVLLILLGAILYPLYIRLIKKAEK
jgi:hypothetical protein